MTFEISKNKLDNIAASMEFSFDAGSTTKGMLLFSFDAVKDVEDNNTKMDGLENLLRDKLREAGFELQPESVMRGNTQDSYNELAIPVVKIGSFTKFKQLISEVTDQQIEAYTVGPAFVMEKLKGDFSDKELSVLNDIQLSMNGNSPAVQDANKLDFADIIAELAKEGDIFEDLSAQDAKDGGNRLKTFEYSVESLKTRLDKAKSPVKN